MSVIDFKKKVLMGVGGWGELYPGFFLDFWIFFNFAKPLSGLHYGILKVTAVGYYY